MLARVGHGASIAARFLAAVTRALGPLAVSAIVPTIGRPALLAECLASLFACDPAPAEVVVVDQSGGDEVMAVVDALGRVGGAPRPLFP